MRRVNLSGLAAVFRTAEGAAALSPASSTTKSTTASHQLVRIALYSTGSNNDSSHWRSRWVSGNYCKLAQSTACAAVAIFSVAAATPLAEEVHAKEPLPEKICPKEVVLYQYEACPFCNKVKAFLDYYDIPYKVVEVNPISKKEIKWSDYKKVPILMVDGEQMIDSSAIIDKLSQKIRSEDSAKSNVQVENEEKKWRGWVDSHLVHVLSPNIYRNASEALESFDYITSHGNFSFMEKITAKYAGAVAMYFVSKNLKKKYNITDERASLYEAAETWVDALNGRDFLGGSKPNLADLAVFGVLRPIRYLKSGKDMVEHTRIGDWYTRMENAVGIASRIQA